jgi:toxin ParE1/3/4
MKHRLTRTADADIEHILRETLRLFGPNQLETYAGHLTRAVALIAENPDRIGCAHRSEIAPGVRSLHLEIAARRRHAAAHIVYFQLNDLQEGEPEIIVLRVLHERMEPKRRLIQALREAAGDE